jgi:threo-3-hydroxy-L-aspartate ammonia-lyase
MDLRLADLRAAQARINPFVLRTPLLSSRILNRMFGHDFLFKAENLQRVGAFKARGAMNALLWAKETHSLPSRVCAVSSGNHAQAVAWAASLLGIPSKIFMPANVSQIKAHATRAYGAQVVLTPDRQTAESAALEEQSQGAFFIPPYDHDQVICGQGTACVEAMETEPSFDAVVAPIGGGGLIAGTVIAAKELSSASVIGAEPDKANDAALSFRSGRICSLGGTPPTICDGVRTLRVSERTFHYIQQLEDIVEVSDEEIIISTQWLTHLLKATIEPTAALSFVGAVKWGLRQPTRKRVLVLLTGGNLDHSCRSQVYSEAWLEKGLDAFVERLRGSALS